jgi:hypothetical protein
VVTDISIDLFTTISYHKLCGKTIKCNLIQYDSGQQKTRLTSGLCGAYRIALNSRSVEAAAIELTPKTLTSKRFQKSIN